MAGTIPDALLARAALWHWGAQAFWYPEAAFLTDLRRGATWRKLAALTSRAAGPEITTRIADLRQASRALPGARLSLPEEHTFLFARRVPVPPRETGYALPGAERTGELAALGAFYAAFGFQVSDAHPELPDHVSVELEFVAALLAKEAYALSEGWDDRGELTRAACGRFLTEHLELWFSVFAERLRQHARLEFYPAVSELVLSLLRTEQSTRPAASDRRGPCVGS